MGKNEDLTLSQKLVLLMALVEASRTSELGALDIRFRTYRPAGFVFKLASLIKMRTPGLPPKELFFDAFPGDQRLCSPVPKTVRAEILTSRWKTKPIVCVLY